MNTLHYLALAALLVCLMSVAAFARAEAVCGEDWITVTGTIVTPKSASSTANSSERSRSRTGPGPSSSAGRTITT